MALASALTIKLKIIPVNIDQLTPPAYPETSNPNNLKRG